uniref:Condensin complex subunit 2 n=1 Tax=Theileria annulata TaxID=5874 RepID=A0A3B0MZS4_THEAN
MDDFEVFTPVDSRLDRDFKSTTTLESRTDLSSLSFNCEFSSKSRESDKDQPNSSSEEDDDVIVPNGFNSILFLPILDALYRPNSLKKELVVNIDLGKLSSALLSACRMVENPFSLVGDYVKGLCLLLMTKVKYLSSDLSAYAKRLCVTDLAVQPKAKAINYYESDTEYEPKSKPKHRRKRKIKDTDSVSTIQDLNERYHSELVPIERLEMLRVMNLGLSGTDFFFQHNQLSPVIKDYINELNLSSKLSKFNLDCDRDWLSFDDLRMLSSPFKLNAYSFTPENDDATVVASSDISFDTSYDIDWSLKNDPLNYNNKNYDYDFPGYLEDDYNQKLLSISDDKSRRRKTNTMKLFDVSLVRAEPRYDRKPAKYKYKRNSSKRRLSTVLSTDLSNKVIDFDKPNKASELDKTFRENVSERVNPRQKTLDQMFDQYFSRVVGTNLGSTVTKTVNKTSELGPQTDQNRTVHVRPTHEDNQFRSKPSDNTGLDGKKTTEDEAGSASYVIMQETNDGFGTLDILNWLRETFRKVDFESITFDKLTEGLDAGKASLVFLRVLILANSNFISVTQDKRITISPSVCIN